jgi:hypothetical protein
METAVENSQSTRSAGDTKAQCVPLNDASTLEIFKRNGFRITGLAVDATPKEVSKRGDKLRMMEELGQGAAANTNAFPLTPSPTVDEIREALQRLKDPEHRLIDEFFWFWPESFGESGKDEAIQAYVKGDGEKAFDLWIERKADPEKSPVAYHNLAVVNHLMAIEWMLHSLNAAPDEESQTRIDAYWVTAIRYWKRTAVDDRVWDVVKARIRSLDDPRLTTGFARRMREGLLPAVANINALFAYKLIERGRMADAGSQIKYIDRYGLEPSVKEELFVRLLQPLRDRFSGEIKSAHNGNDPRKRFAAAQSVVAQASSVSHLFETFLGKSSIHYTELFNEMAMACGYSGNAYQKETGDFEGYVTVTKAALPYATSPEAKKLLKENLEFGEQSIRRKSIAPFLADLQEIINSSELPREKLRMVKESIIPRLATIIQDEGSSSELAQEAQTSVGWVIRGLGLNAHNEHKDVPTAKEAIKLASKLARDPELKDKLAEDQKVLDENEEGARKNRLELQIRSDVVEINREFVRYNDTRLPVAAIGGIRFGIYHHRTNGIQDSCSYIVGVGSRQKHISIECKRFFRSESQAQSDYQAIVRALYLNVIPDVAEAIGKLIKTSGYKLGASNMTKDGMTLPRRGWLSSEEIMVPYAQVRYGYHQGSLNLFKVGEDAVRRSFPVRDIWNAIIFEEIMTAIGMVKLKK